MTILKTIQKAINNNRFTGGKNPAEKLREEMHNNSQTYLYNVGKPVWCERNYEEFCNEAYKNNVIAHRAIRMVSEAAASIPIVLYKYVNGKKYPVTDHPILELFNNPNPTQNSKEFFESIYTYKQLSGNAYVLYIHPENTNDISNNEGSNIKKYHELYTLRPDRVQIISGVNFIPSGYRYTVNNDYIDYPVDPITGKSDILHIKSFHPLSDWYGMSTVEAALYSINQHNQASAWNQALLQNGARPSGAIVVKNADGKPMMLNEMERNRLRKSIEENFAGAENAGRPLVLEGGLEWQAMGSDHDGMQFMECKNNAAREIALAFGVPPQLLCISGDNTYTNLAESRLALWEQTVIPLVENTIDHFNKWIISHYNKNEMLELSCDLSGIIALANRQSSTWDRLANADFMTRNEKRSKVGLPPLNGE